MTSFTFTDDVPLPMSKVRETQGRHSKEHRIHLARIIDGPFKPLLASAVLAAIFFVQLAFVISTPKSVSWDPSYGLLAAQQHLAGVSPSIFTLVEAGSSQITQVSTRPVSYWAPAYQAVPYALRLDVFDWGVALNLTLRLVLIVGAIGWFVYFAQVLGVLVLLCGFRPSSRSRASDGK